MSTVLICDDERDIVNALRIYLSTEGYELAEAYNGKEALERVRKGGIQLVIMDIMMPVMDGITAMSEIRKISNIPVILLTAKAEDTDKILGLNVGADDYITKPFNPVEVLARVKSQLRRYLQLGGGQSVGRTTLIHGGIEMDDFTKSVTLDGDPVALTPTEYDILKLFLEHPGQVFSPGEIYHRVWNDPFGSDGTVAVHIRHLREKIEVNPADPRYIKVVWGRGYKMEGNP